ncbi:alpha/beta hydrolase [Pseudomonas yamanorum]|uniref:Alpha/beta hydrolase n=1 Tax=Pseudomonas yamanorum TaxID=515393 RepID=A0A7Y8FJ51_9PSED|nr:alpha/beta hydrolase [Pseudomonas yamanorum]NWE17267.1 alpha/beta hydrolase [Pseudomonas yamanorum]NWE79934.1 alpha/beta hydrolase [Pseudomonas yamanorum]
MSVNPDISAYLQLVNNARAEGKTVPMHASTPEDARVGFDQSSLLMSIASDELEHVQELQVPARDASLLPARLYSRRSPTLDAPQPALLYFHGGGYVVGSLDSHDALCRTLAELADCVVLSVAYRLAPQWRFPTAVEDAQDAWHWLRHHAASLGIDPARLAIGGDSVGGSLATVVANGCDRAHQPRVQVLIYPVTDASASTASTARYATGHLLEAQTLQWFYQHYERTPQDRLDPRFSPLLAAPNAQAAPVLLVLAECDPLHDEGVAYAARLREAGVAVDMQVFEGMTHDFLRMDALVDEAQDAQALIAQALKSYLG